MSFRMQEVSDPLNATCTLTAIEGPAIFWGAWSTRAFVSAHFKILTLFFY